MKKIIPFVCLSVLCSSFLFAQDMETKIDERLINSVIHITIPNKNIDSISFGTGFLISVFEKVPITEKVYLVTNKHMVGSWSLVDSFIPYDNILIDLYPKIKSNPIIQKAIKIKNSLGNLSSFIILHPNPLVDLALIDLTNLYKENLNSNIYWQIADSSFLMGSAEMEKLKIGYGEQVFAIGYPSNVMISGSNLPIAKSSYISSSTRGNFKVDLNIFSRKGELKKASPGGNFFLVDGLIIGGNSGGPVICANQTTIGFTKDKLGVTRSQRSSGIIGIVSMFLPGTGIAVIYSSDNILDLINASVDMRSN
jgi:S1-C subfamily serine protease